MKKFKIPLFVLSLFVVVSLACSSLGGTNGPSQRDVEKEHFDTPMEIISMAKCEINQQETAQGYKEKWIVKYRKYGQIGTDVLAYDGYTWKSSGWVFLKRTGCPNL